MITLIKTFDLTSVTLNYNIRSEKLCKFFTINVYINLILLNHFLNNFCSFLTQSTTDCILQVEGQPIHVHKAILKIRCQHFKKKFQEKGTENDER